MGRILRIFVNIFFFINISSALAEEINNDSRTQSNIGKQGEYQTKDCGERRSKPGDPVDIYVDFYTDSRRSFVNVSYCIGSALQDAKVKIGEFTARLKITTDGQETFAATAGHQFVSPQSGTMGSLRNDTYVPLKSSSKATQKTIARFFIEGAYITAEGIEKEFALYPSLEIPISSLRIKNGK